MNTGMYDAAAAVKVRHIHTEYCFCCMADDSYSAAAAVYKIYTEYGIF